MCLQNDHMGPWKWPGCEGFVDKAAVQETLPSVPYATQKMEEASLLIKRDIVFAASLYTA
jgi:hypothetical protein